MDLSRRQFMIGCSAAIAAMSGTWITNLAFAGPKDTATRDLLVLISLRGGMDGLSLVAPVNDGDYIANRGGIGIPESGTSAGLRLANGPVAGLDFRLNAVASPLKELYDSKSLAIIHACGLTNGTRSHFEAQEYMDRGIGTASNTAAGWLTRHLAVLGNSTIPGMTPGSATPGSLIGDSRVVAMPDVSNFKLQNSKYVKQQQAALYTLYEGNTAIHQTGRGTLDAITKIDSSIPKDKNGNPTPYVPENGAVYDNGLSNALKNVARLAKMDVGLQVAAIDTGGWDHHENLVPAFNATAANLARSLSAFYNDMVRYYDKLTVVVVSEFGRRVKANGSAGTDHGHGGVMMVLGGYVNGGKIYGSWPGLAVEQLDNRVDLAITTDYRNVLSEVLITRAGNAAIDQVFPGFTGYAPMGLVRGNGTPNTPPKAPPPPAAQPSKVYLPNVRK
ncbi:MAG: DUF1501 domain-containing protein [Chloroflexales bacterium]|nr:DUF1501 domain-containing protein [Chloroflexales bacterium]